MEFKRAQRVQVSAKTTARFRRGVELHERHMPELVSSGEYRVKIPAHLEQIDHHGFPFLSSLMDRFGGDRFGLLARAALASIVRTDLLFELANPLQRFGVFSAFELGVPQALARLPQAPEHLTDIGIGAGFHRRDAQPLRSGPFNPRQHRGRASSIGGQCQPFAGQLDPQC